MTTDSSHNPVLTPVSRITSYPVSTTLSLFPVGLPGNTPRIDMIFILTIWQLITRHTNRCNLFPPIYIESVRDITYHLNGRCKLSFPQRLSQDVTRMSDTLFQHTNCYKHWLCYNNNDLVTTTMTLLQQQWLCYNNNDFVTINPLFLTSHWHIVVGRGLGSDWVLRTPTTPPGFLARDLYRRPN